MKFSARAGSAVHEVVVERDNGHYVVEIDGVRRVVDAQKLEADFYTILDLGDSRSYEVSVEPRGDGYIVRHGAAECEVVVSDPSRRAREAGPVGTGPLTVSASMPGKVVRVLVVAGGTVQAGQGLIVVEAMKMENEIAAPRAGRVKHVAVAAGQTVESGVALVEIE